MVDCYAQHGSFIGSSPDISKEESTSRLLSNQPVAKGTESLEHTEADNEGPPEFQT